jgi:preprotein translocase subunit SecD
MIQVTRWKIIVVSLAVLFGVLFTLPNLLTPAQLKQLPGFLPHQTLHLGLDLQGGSYLMYEVDMKALKKERLTSLTEDVRKKLNDENIGAAEPVIDGDAVRVQITDPTKTGQALSALTTLSQPLADSPTVREFLVAPGPNNTVVFTMPDQAVKAEGVAAVKRSIGIILKRIDKSGARQPSVVSQGLTRIVIEAPGESDPEKIKELVGRTAHLTFQMVDQSMSVEEAQATHAPPGSIVLPLDDKNSPAKFILVKKRVVVSGDDLTDAHYELDPEKNQPAIAFSFNGKGSEKFGNATLVNVGKPFAIILDDRVLEAPNIQTPIMNGHGQITGSFTPESASELAELLRNGALPARLIVQEQRTVGPGLGAEAVQAGEISVAIGAVLIVAFVMLSYGGLFGGVSVIGLVVNGLMMLGALSLTQATLTLPGIAGLILTLAVAVDANVLIYERMREEARAGRPPMSAADHGFSRAIITIIDANLTTLTAAVIMLWFGAGPVRGFAWTLSIGVFTSVFSAVMVSQVLLGLWLKFARPKKLPIV